MDSVVGLCSGIESNISKNKDTQSYVHSEFKSSAYRMMSSEERWGKAERAYILIINPVNCCVSVQCNEKETVQKLKGNIAKFQHLNHTVLFYLNQSILTVLPEITVVCPVPKSVM